MFVKVISKSNLLAAAKREAYFYATCRHKNVIKLQECFEQDTKLFIVTNCQPGGDLVDYLYTQPKLSEKRIKILAFQIGQGISYLHANHILHRDIKPENVLMSRADSTAVPLLTDFGVAIYLGKGQRARQVAGTVGYMAPEVILDKPYSYPCDVWSFGCLIFRMITGHRPFVSNEANKQENFK